MLGRLAQSVTRLTADMCLTANTGAANLITARSHTFVEIDHEIISTVFLLPSPWFKKVSYKYVHKILVNRLVKLAQEKNG